MHLEAYEFVAAHATSNAVAVLDVGGRNINGTVRGLFPGATSYTVVDLVEADGVDVVGDITGLGLVDVADVVVCAEVLEHAANWADIVSACAAACRPGGTVIITAAGPGREPHSAIDGEALRKGEHYANIEPDALYAALVAIVDDATVETAGHDVRAVANLAKPRVRKAAATKKATAKKSA
jgi:SAM-dependent methyltransferase